jgi:hypothetical protein
MIRFLILSLIVVSNSLNAAEVGIKTDLELRALRYFRDNANPETGMILETAENQEGVLPNSTDARRSSIAATGFGLVVLVNAGLRGLIPRREAMAYAEKVLTFATAKLETRKGWFYHFVDWRTGERWDKSEYSTIDTAFFIGGALYAGQAFPNTEISRLAYELYERLDFIDMMTNGGTLPNKRQLAMSYRAEDGGYSSHNWKNYAEHTLLILLGLGRRDNPLPPTAWTAFERQTTLLPSGERLIGGDKPLFEHQYSHLFIDYRSVNDAYGNYFKNSILATRYHQEFCASQTKYETFREGFWGLSAGDYAGGYVAFSPTHFDGTVCPACTVGSAMFLPGLVFPSAQAWRDNPKYRDRLWGKYGFADGINVDKNWIAPIVHGITVGPVYLSIANIDEATSVWKIFMQIPEIKRALQIAQRTRPSAVVLRN